MQASGDPFDGEDGLFSQARGEGEFAWIGFQAQVELGLCPAQALQDAGAGVWGPLDNERN